ncbi:DUF305 domain-containing protein [Streptomyces sp. NK15101]|uniref:DUF305 domain-containing protein n=1 Tax=Streptomyces sp. NK15101 TaxID=2873261 RepID=UPI001CED5270|nr:DUF305 domain-containing protein [Streptomyces sp. NK15101]
MRRPSPYALIAAAAALVAGLTLTGCGEDDPAAPATTSPATTTPQLGAHDEADVTFAQQTIPHHRQAVTMSQMAESDAATRSVRELADRITKTQTAEIVHMRDMLHDS